MTPARLKNMRVHFYGVQGSGSVYPSAAEREQMREQMEVQLLEEVLRKATEAGRIGQSTEDLIGGPLNAATLRQYRRGFSVPEPRSYGGWTTCVHVETADGYDFVFDCGSGFRHCAEALQRKWGEQPERHLYLFGSHSHSDHSEGFDQAAVCFDPRNAITVYGNASFLRALDSYLGIFTRSVQKSERGLRSPLSYDLMPAKFNGIEILPSEGGAKGNNLFGEAIDTDQPLQIGKTRIIPFEVHHTSPCLAYRVEYEDRVFVFCTDHELRHGDPQNPSVAESHTAEQRLRRYSARADLLYRDGQYLRAEYDGLAGIGGSTPVSRAGWGHSCIEDVERMAEDCQIRRACIGHHDPNREWADRNRIDEALAKNNEARYSKVELARAECIVDL